MNCEYVNILLGLSTLTALIFIPWFLIKYPKAPFISKAYVLLKKPYLYPLIFIAIGAPIMIVSEFNIYFTISGSSLILVAYFPDYRIKWVNIPHSTFAFTAGLFSFIGYYDKGGNWLIIIPYIAISSILLWKSNKPVKWLEVLTFAYALGIMNLLFYC